MPFSAVACNKTWSLSAMWINSVHTLMELFPQSCLSPSSLTCDALSEHMTSTYLHFFECQSWKRQPKNFQSRRKGCYLLFSFPASVYDRQRKLCTAIHLRASGSIWARVVMTLPTKEAVFEMTIHTYLHKPATRKKCTLDMPSSCLRARSCRTWAFQAPALRHPWPCSTCTC